MIAPLPGTDPGLKSWLRLLRIPNIFTVPGDPLVGLFVTASGQDVPFAKVILICLAAIAFYECGMVMNDLLDYDEDLEERPDRPLPSGQLSCRAALIAIIALGLTALLLSALVSKAALYTGLMLLALILLYNLGMKRVLVLGPLNMGLCRGCSVLLGAAALTEDVKFTLPTIVIFEIITVYFAFITLLARNETKAKSSNPVLTGWLLPLSLIAGTLAMLRISPVPQPLFSWSFYVLIALAILSTLHVARTVFQQRQVTPNLIGRLISLNMLLQIAFLMYHQAVIPAVCVLLLWPSNRLFLRRYYAS